MSRRRRQRLDSALCVLRASQRARKVLMLTGLHREFALPGPETAATAYAPQPSAYRCGYWPAAGGAGRRTQVTPVHRQRRPSVLELAGDGCFQQVIADAAGVTKGDISDNDV